MTKLLLLSGDLMLGARVEGAARKCGLTMVTAVDSSQAIETSAEDCRVVVVDLRTPGLDIAGLVVAIRQRSVGTAIIACGPHVHEQRLDSARQAGCDMVVTRGQFDRDAESIVGSLVEKG